MRAGAVGIALGHRDSNIGTCEYVDSSEGPSQDVDTQFNLDDTLEEEAGQGKVGKEWRAGRCRHETVSVPCGQSLQA